MNDVLRNKDGAFIFSAEQVKALERNGYTVYALTGKTFREIRQHDDVLHISVRNRYDLPQLLDLRALKGQVAMRNGPKAPLNKYGDWKKQNEHDELIKAHAKEIEKKIPGVTAIAGTLSDYAELALNQLQVEKDLFGERLPMAGVVLTSTVVQENLGENKLVPKRIAFGQLDPVGLSQAWDLDPDYSGIELFSIPLIVPKGIL